MQSCDVVIVGAGQAAAQLAISLRQGGYAGSIAIFGEEPDLPYERPPLSKEYLTGLKSADRLAIRSAQFWVQSRVELNLGCRVSAVDPGQKAIRCEDGRTWGYGTLVWAAGGRARRLQLAGGDLDGIYTVRSRADVDRLRAGMPAMSRVAIIGAGYIGLEVAPALLKAGKQVVVIEAQARVLARVAGPELSAYVQAVHETHGVKFRLGTRIQGLVGSAGAVAGVALENDAEPVVCDAIIAAVGMTPTIDVLMQAGAQAGDGIEVDSFCQTSLRDVFAIGDCANHSNPWAGNVRLRVESVPNAVEQAKTVAGVLLGKPAPFSALPWFWSYQYDLKIQSLGLALGAQQRVVRATTDPHSFSIAYLKEGRVIALDCVNAPRDFAQGKALIEKRAVVPLDLLGDATVPLRDILARSWQGELQ